MPLLIFRLLPAYMAEQKSRKIAQTFQKERNNLIQFFRSARAFGIFFTEVWVDWYWDFRLMKPKGQSWLELRTNRKPNRIMAL